MMRVPLEIYKPDDVNILNLQLGSHLHAVVLEAQTNHFLYLIKDWESAQELKWWFNNSRSPIITGQEITRKGSLELPPRFKKLLRDEPPVSVRRLVEGDTLTFRVKVQ